MTVYRRDDFAFPPARGRRGVEFGADGTFVDCDRPGRRPEALPGVGQLPAVDRGSGVGRGDRPVRPDRLEIRWGVR